MALNKEDNQNKDNQNKEDCNDASICHSVDIRSQTIEEFLDHEKNTNRKDSWNKLDRTTKLQKLHHFAEKYGKDQSLSSKDIKSLKQFLKISLDKQKLQKTKEVTYDKNNGLIKHVPGLIFNNISNQYTLRNLDRKVSTLKSLTPTTKPVL